MAFTLGNHSIDEILYGVFSHDGKVVYTIDQLSTASIEISSESTEITDKRGNVVRTIYKTKTGTFNATNAFLHPQIINAASGASILDAATVDDGVQMPKIEILAAGATEFELNVDPTTGEKLGEVLDETIEVIGIYGSGANTAPLEAGDVVSDTTFVYVQGADKISVPAGGEDKPVKYLVKYERIAKGGIKLTNSANEFPDSGELLLFASYVDPCD